MQSYIRVLKYFRPYVGYLAAAIVSLLIATGANLVLPWIVKNVVDKVLIEKNTFMLNMIAIAIVASFLLKGIFSYAQVYFMSFATQRVVTNLREIIYRHLQKLSLDFYEKRQTGEIMSRLTNDIALLQGILTGGVVEWLTESCTFVGSLAFLFYIDWKLALLTVVVLPLIAWLVNKLGKKVRKVAGVVQSKLADITSVLQETISGIRIIKAFAREDYEIAKFSKHNQESFRATLKSTRVSAILGPIVEFVGSFGIVAIVWYGGHEVIQGGLTSGDLVAFLIYVITMSAPMNRLSRLYGNAQQASAAADRIFEVLDTEPQIKEVANAKILRSVQGKVAFKNVSFAYEEDNVVLKNINLEANPGEVIALVGPSGAGKTTVVDLIPRFYEPCEGTVSVDGQDIRQFTLASLREQIAIVPQDIILFNGTIGENIAYGRLDTTQEEIVLAAQGANAHEFISNLPEGYQTQIGDRGVKLSGGQRQRLAIARAILKNPRILILDEATSALDTESEILVQEALERLMKRRTTFVIAHRLSTIRNANQILVIDKGQIVEKGSHNQLLAKGGLYNRLYEAQFKAQEALSL